MPRLRDLATLIRSKNAGPFQLTFDIMFEDAATFRRVVASGVINRELFARLYNLPPERVHLTTYEPGLAIKATIPRPVPAGGRGDSDMLGGQQYGPLVDVEVP